MRVAVVGAGLAGLAAAEALSSAGIEVVVLEGRDRVGGRVWSRELPNGAVVELGAEFVLPGNDTIRAFVGRLGLGWWDKGMRYGQREPRGVEVTQAELRRATQLIREALAGVQAGVSAEQLLGRLDLDAGAREAIRARLEVSCATTVDRVGARALAGLAAHSDDVSPSLAGGNQGLAHALAKRLGAAVRLSSPVWRIAWGEAGAVVSAGGGEVEAGRVVLALPASVIDRIGFEPALPGRLATAYASVEYGHAAKLFVPLEAPAPPSAVMSVPERYWSWTATGGAGVQPVVSCFAGSGPSLRGLEVEKGAGTWVASLRRLRPDLALSESGAVLSTWDDDPWVGAAYSSAAPPVEAWGPAGPFHVCGEHTAGDHAALMDGALASGVRAAGEIVAALQSPAQS